MMSRFLSLSNRFLIGAILFGSMAGFTVSSHAQMTTEVSQPANSAEQQQITEMQKVADRWDDAIDQRDQYALELVLAPQYIDISDTGEVWNRDQVVSQLVAKDAPRYSLTQKVITARLIGDTMIVNGTYDRKYEAPRLSHTKMKEERGVFSQVYIRARSSWACINSQQTLIVGTAAKTSKKKSNENSTEKPVNNNLGFHFPGFHHSDNDSSPQQ